MTEQDTFHVAPEDQGQIPDVTIAASGGLVFVTPQSARAHNWVELHLDAATRYAGSVVIEPRYLDDIIGGMHNDGLTVTPE